MTDEKKAKGGFARAKSLTAEERKRIARQGALARWDADVPQASHEAPLKIGNAEVHAAVLPNGKRLLTQATFLRALGRSRSPKAGTGVLSTVDGLPFFLQAKVLQPFINEDLSMSTTPIFFRTKEGKRAVGYDAELLPKVCEVYLKFRDECLAHRERVPEQYKKIVRACDILMRGLARVGIIALIDEATGYQKDRAKDALAQILEAFIAKELQPWLRTFPSDFYQEMFRLRELPYPSTTVKRPQYFGVLTNNVVYDRLAPGVLEELKRGVPRNENGRPTAKYFQKLTQNTGYPKLREHLGSVVTLMKLSHGWKDFMEKLDKFHPRFGDTLPLDLAYEKESDDGQGL